MNLFNFRAFTLPMLHTLLSNPQRLFGLVLTPTRELAFQIAEQVEALGKPNSSTAFTGLFFIPTGSHWQDPGSE